MSLRGTFSEPPHHANPEAHFLFEPVGPAAQGCGPKSSGAGGTQGIAIEKEHDPASVYGSWNSK